MAKKKAASTTTAVQRANPPLEQTSRVLLEDLRGLIIESRGAVAQAVNSVLVRLYWEVGNRIRREILRNERAEYGQQIVSTVSKQLTGEFGSGYSKPNLTRMIRFAEHFHDESIVAALSRQLS